MTRMENIQRAMNRQKTAQHQAEAFEAPTIHTIDDIKRVLHELDPTTRLNQAQEDILLKTDLTGSDGRKSTNFQVETKTSSKSHRQLLLEGFQVIKTRLETAERLEQEETIRSVEVDGKPMTPPAVVNTEGRHAMDAIIERLLGAYRDGPFICWNLADGYMYRYEIFQHRLTRVPRDAGDTSPAPGGV